MTTALVLIVAILVLGGVIAIVGDRLGMRIGKARLSLFNLRPRQTATLVTVLTGSLISAMTFGILFAVDDQLRTGVFELQEIQTDLQTAREDLTETRQEKRQIQVELSDAIAEQNAAQERLQQINRSLRQAIARQSATEERLQRTQGELQQTQTRLGQIQGRFQQAQSLLVQVTQQASRLRGEIQQLQTDQQELVRQRDQVRAQIAQRDLEIAARNQEIAERNQEIILRDQAIAEREALLQQLEGQRSFLAQEVQVLEREFQNLRQGNVAILRNQTLASGVVRVVNPDAAPQAVDQLLREANRIVLQRVKPGTTDLSQQVIQITNTQVEQLITGIRDGNAYVVRIISAGNYVVGEPCVAAGNQCIQVFADAAINQVIFPRNTIVAATSANPFTMSAESLVDRINLLVAASQFRARQAGIVSDTIQIADGRTETIVGFFERLQQYNQPIDIQAVAADDIFTAGPVRLELLAVQDGQVLFGTQVLSQ